MDHLSAPSDDSLEEQYRTLLDVGKAIFTHRDLHELIRDLAQRLPRVVQVNFIGLSLHDPERNMMQLYSLQANVPADLIGGHVEPMDETPAGLVFTTQQPVLVPHITDEQRWPTVLQRMQEDGINSFCFVPLTTSVRRLGTIGFSSLQKEAYSKVHVEFLQQVGKQVAVAVDNVLHHQDLIHDRDRLRLLLEVTESIASHHDADRLLHDLAQRLPRIVPFDYINIVLHDPGKDVMRLWLLVTAMPCTIEPGLEMPMKESPGGLVWETQQPLTVPDIAHEHRFQRLIAILRENGVQSFCAVPLTTAHQRLGALGFGSLERRTYDASEIQFMHQVAKQVAIAVENALNYERAQSTQVQLMRERDHQRLLLEVNNAVVTHLDLEDLFAAVSTCLRKAIQHDGSSLLLCNEETGEWRIHVLDFQRNESFIEEGKMEEAVQSPSCLAINTGQAALFREQDLKEMASASPCAQDLLDRGVKSFCSLPLFAHQRTLGALNVGRRKDDGFTAEDIELLSQVAQQVAIAVENALAYKQIAQLKDKLTEEKLYLEEEIQTDYNFEEIVGESHALKQVLKQITTVAPLDSTVLILGETGSGKELVARALHNLSTRRERTFLKLNCAAIPTGLLESELFGHERGAFTGAIATKVGRFELADRGTLFLDEVGEIPLELQVKLLRVLQEQEFERLGSTRTIRTNVRVVAATNRDLTQMVEEQQFRSDLYYRLKVFPITVPPLRERPEDISLLVRHFAQKLGTRMKKRIQTIPTESMKAMQAYPWPGNVRELENFIERAVILSTGSDLMIPLSELTPLVTPAYDSVATLEDAEREHILKVLRDSKWTLSGPAGAAAKLGMKRTTLHSKMKKLGIVRPS